MIIFPDSCYLVWPISEILNPISKVKVKSIVSYIAICALHPRVKGGFVFSVQWDDRVRYLGIMTCCPILLLSERAILKLYRFKWRMRTLENKRMALLIHMEHRYTLAKSIWLRDTAGHTGWWWPHLYSLAPVRQRQVVLYKLKANLVTREFQRLYNKILS